MSSEAPGFDAPHPSHAWGYQTLLVAILAILIPRSRSSAQESTPRPLPSASAFAQPIIFAQIPTGAERDNPPARSAGLLRADYGEGGRIAILRPDTGPEVLSAGFASACDPQVSFDGRHILFAGKKRSSDPWNIWEIGIDGSGLRRITRAEQDCRSPIYLSSLFTLNSPQPWYTALFVRTERDALNEGGTRLATHLFSVRLDGSEMRQISFNPGGEFDPFQMADGRVIFAGWQCRPEPASPLGRVALFGVNIDGTDYALLGGRQGRRIQHMPCTTSAGLVIFVEADRIEWDGAGCLAALELRRPQHSYRPLSSADQGLFHSPAPLGDGTILVSRRGAAGRTTHGIYRFDPASGSIELLYDDPERHEIQAHALQPRKEPDGRSTVVRTEDPTGTLFCLNAFDTEERLRPHFTPGLLRRLRVLEGVPASSSTDSPSDPPRLTRRLLGDVPIEADGSFNLVVPADIPIQLQVLDRDGMALATCRWIWVKQRESRGCIGCHEDPELTPENRFVQAVRRPSTRLTLPVSQRRTVSFQRDIWPVLRRKCATAACHASDRTPLRLPPGASERDARDALTALLAPTRGERGPAINPGRARTSLLIWKLFGRQTSRPWDRPADGKPARSALAAHQHLIDAMPPPGRGEPLTELERRKVIEWIDLGAPR